MCMMPGGKKKQKTKSALSGMFYVSQNPKEWWIWYTLDKIMFKKTYKGLDSMKQLKQNMPRSNLSLTLYWGGDVQINQNSLAS